MTIPTGSRPRVAITGIGLITPAGRTIRDVFDVMLAGKSTASTVPALVAADSPVTFAATVAPFDPGSEIPARERQKMDRAALLAVIAADSAVADAGGLASLDPDRIGVAIGTGAAGIPSVVATALAHERDGTAYPAFTVPRIMANSPAARIAMRFGCHGSALTYATACASGATALGEAAMKIRCGQLDAALAGGADAAVVPEIIGSFHQLRAMSVRNTDPATAARPFDTDRDGFVMGEGATIVLLERWELAERRGARIYGELAGYASNCDAHHIVAPSADGIHAAACMAAALRDAGVAPEQVGHINAHGTGTVLNDRAEAIALHRCFAANPPPVTASKGVVGHMFGAAGAFEAVIALLSARANLVPPVANFGAATDIERLDIVAGTARPIGSAPVLSNSFGFGGHNSCLVLASA